MTEATLWDVVDIALTGPATGNPYREVTLAATFRQGDRALTAQGFHDGDGVYRVRFMPDATGDWTWETVSNAPALHARKGAVTVGPARPGAHGPVVADGLRLRHADGTPFINLGTTAYAWHHQSAAMQAQTLATLAKAPFTKIRMCVFPKHYRYNETEPEHYPFALLKKGSSRWPATRAESGWTFDFDRPNPAFFRALEDNIRALGRIGVQADLILMHPYDRWGFDHMSPEQDDRYLAHVVSRLAAFANVWWSMANEYDLMPNKSVTDWDRFIRIVSQTDPHGHLLGNHNCFPFYDHSHPAITHCSVQHEHTALAAKWRTDYRKPVSIDECCYEGDIEEAWGNISGREMVHRIWTGVMNGAGVTHGETLWNEGDAIWWAKGGTLRGQSVPRIAFLRRILEQAPGFEPVETNFAYRMNAAGDRTNMTMPRLQIPDPAERDWLPRVWSMYEMVGKAHEYYLVYLGTRQPRGVAAAVPPGERYDVTLVDTWEMTETPLAQGIARGDVITMPGTSHLALILRRSA